MSKLWSKFVQWFRQQSSETRTGLVLVAGIAIAVPILLAIKGVYPQFDLSNDRGSTTTPSRNLTMDEVAAETRIGRKPESSAYDGSVQPVKEYLRSHLNDYDSAEFVEWTGVFKTSSDGQDFWTVGLKLRAKNAFGAYVLHDTVYYIQNGRVVKADGLLP